jgi:endonuclease/exonuclease/phosphatase family metal-dependent hydrolase
VLVDAIVDDEQVRFVSSHLEPVTMPELQPLQQAQAAELIQAAGDGPVIVVGDLNTTAPGGASYEMFMAAGFRDAWSDLNPTTAGPTCCFNSMLQSGARMPDKRFDLVLFKSSSEFAVIPRTVRRTGTDPVAGFGSKYASDHLGVVARLEIED